MKRSGWSLPFHAVFLFLNDLPQSNTSGGQVLCPKEWMWRMCVYSATRKVETANHLLVHCVELRGFWISTDQCQRGSPKRFFQWPTLPAKGNGGRASPKSNVTGMESEGWKIFPTKAREFHAILIKIKEMHFSWACCSGKFKCATFGDLSVIGIILFCRRVLGHVLGRGF